MFWQVNSHAINTDATLHTNGTGLWSARATKIRITDLEVAYVSEELDFGELRVYFNVNDWDVYTHGLIYTDPLFVKELREYLSQLGYQGTLNYSEQGMQGQDYVSLDVDGRFLETFLIKNPGTLSMIEDDQ